MKKTIPSKFGILTKVEIDKYGNLWITNESGHRVQMVAKKWHTEIPRIHTKCNEHIGRNVRIITSQTTAKWRPAEYFCDIESI